MPNDDDSLPVPIPPPRSQTPISHIPTRPPFTRLDREPAAAIVDLGIALPRQTGLFEAVGEPAGGYVRQEGEPEVAHQPERMLKRTPQVETTTNESQPKHVQSQTQSISWARWDTCRETSKSSKLLLIAYTCPTALSVWDCTRLDAVDQILRIGVGEFVGDHGHHTGAEAGSNANPWEVVCAGIVPHAPRAGLDAWAKDRPLLGILLRPEPGGPESLAGKLVLYSLTTLRVVNRVDIHGKGTARVDSFEASSAGFVVISVTSPSGPILHIFSSTSPFFDLLHTIPTTKLTPYAPPPPSLVISPSTLSSTLPLPMPPKPSASVLGRLGFGGSSFETHGWADKARRRISGGDVGYGYGYGYEEEAVETVPHHHQIDTEVPRAVYTLSHRLLAFASPPSPPPPEGLEAASSSAPSVSTSTFTAAAGLQSGAKAGLGLGTGPGGLPSTQAELGSVAVRVGGSVWGGMRTLGGMAVEAARGRASGNLNMNASGALNQKPNGFSKSAPESGRGWGEAPPPHEKTDDGAAEGSYFVTILDLSSLRGQNAAAAPAVLGEFMVSKVKQVSRLAFSADGCSLVVVPRDGHTGRVFRIRPSGSPSYLYNLRRGRTSAVVEGVEWSGDARWVAIGTRRGTVHVFGVNPGGGRVDPRGLVDEKVRDEEEVRPHSGSKPVDVTPVVRLRVTTHNDASQVQIPLCFTFLKRSESAHVLPLPQTHPYVSPPRSFTSAASASDTGSPRAVSPLRATAAAAANTTGVQDMLLFDAVDGTLSLRRVTMEMQSRESQGFGSALGGTSMSLPGVVGAAGWIAGSAPSSVGKQGVVGSGSPVMGGVRSSSRGQGHQGGEMELVVKESTVMTWYLRRRWDGVEIKKGLVKREDREPKVRANWLAQAELSTFSTSKRVLPRSIYLSHQFSFHTLGEDYHALIRRYQFHIAGDKVDVRREVQISAYSAGSGESFVEGFSAPRDVRHRSQLSSSFDEPLASALAAEFDHHPPHTSGVLPMLPNGFRPQTFRSSIPITIRSMTGIGDGMSGSFGKIRREINRVRSPRLKPSHPDTSILSSSVPLEFDEEDEDFVGHDGVREEDVYQPDELLGVPGGGDGDGERSVSRETSRGGSSILAVSTPATSPEEEEGSDGAWDGWSSEDKLALEEVERFDNIDVVGLLDEEQQQERQMKNMMEMPVKKRVGRRRERF